MPNHRLAPPSGVDASPRANPRSDIVGCFPYLEMAYELGIKFWTTIKLRNYMLGRINKFLDLKNQFFFKIRNIFCKIILSKNFLHLANISSILHSCVKMLSLSVFQSQWPDLGEASLPQSPPPPRPRPQPSTYEPLFPRNPGSTLFL